MKVALAGEALIDFTSIGDLQFQGYCGGSPLNTAVAVARLGVPAGYVTQLQEGLGRGELSLWMAKSAIPFASAPARRLDSR